MYEVIRADRPIDQGDVFVDCPIVGLEFGPDGEWEVTRYNSRVIVLTQTCDFANNKVPRVVVARIHSCTEVIAAGHLNEKTIRDQVRAHKMLGWYFLPASDSAIGFQESIVDLRELHSVRLALLKQIADGSKRLCRIVTPWREHLNQHFAVTYMRIGLPEPYPTEA